MYLFIYLAPCNTAHVTLSSQLPQMGRLLLLSLLGAWTKMLFTDDLASVVCYR